MGTRIIYQIASEDGAVVATLFSNNSHHHQVPDEFFDGLLKKAIGPTALVELMLISRYVTGSGSHKAGDRMFWLVEPDQATDGDRELVITATFTNNRNQAWTVRRRDTHAPNR